MKPVDIKNFPAGADGDLSIGRGRFENEAYKGSADEFDRMMDGFKAVDSTLPAPSLTSQWIRAPGAVYERTMVAMDRPPPQFLEPVQAMEFFNDRQTDLFRMKTLNSVVSGFMKLIKKNVELVLNNK